MSDLRTFENLAPAQQDHLHLYSIATCNYTNPECNSVLAGTDAKTPMPADMHGHIGTMLDRRRHCWPSNAWLWRRRHCTVTCIF